MRWCKIVIRQDFTDQVWGERGRDQELYTKGPGTEGSGEALSPRSCVPLVHRLLPITWGLVPVQRSEVNSCLLPKHLADRGESSRVITYWGANRGRIREGPGSGHRPSPVCVQDLAQRSLSQGFYSDSQQNIQISFTAQAAELHPAWSPLLPLLHTCTPSGEWTPSQRAFLLPPALTRASQQVPGGLFPALGVCFGQNVQGP